MAPYGPMASPFRRSSGSEPTAPSLCLANPAPLIFRRAYNLLRMRNRLALAFFVLLAAILAPAATAQAAPPTPDMSKVPWSPVRRNPRLSQPSVAAPAPAPASSSSAIQSPAIQVHVNLVNVLTSVVGADGAPYTALQKDDFHLLEDGVEQKIAVFERQSSLPLSIVLALDTSLSTRKDLRVETGAARRFAADVLRPADSLAIFQFSNDVSQALGFTNDQARIDDALQHLRTGRATALYDAIFLASRSLARRQGRKIIVLITDGGDTASKSDYPEALRAAQHADAVLFSIILVPIESEAGRDIGGEHALIQLASDTGGQYYYASSLPQLDEAFHRIGDELRTQYLLAYYPSRRRGPEFRRITVELTPQARQKAAGALTLRYRAGYYSADGEQRGE
jgi:Ca-activated chloride channel family protein